MIRFTVKITLVLLLALSFKDISAQNYAENSVLKDGTIYKIGVTEDGFYRISFDELSAAGVDISALNHSKISLFGNKSGMLPENNTSTCYDDLTEMNISVDENGIVFYGQSPVKWKFNGTNYIYNTNYYSDTTFYFLKIDNQEDGKRFELQEEPSGEPGNIVNSFLDKQFHETDLHNYYHRGRKWYGETIEGDNPEMTFPFVFKNADTGKKGFVEARFIGASKTENFVVRLKVNGEQVGNDIEIKKVGDYSFGVEEYVSSDFNLEGDDIDVSLEFVANNVSTFVGVDYIAVNTWRSLSYNDEQLQFAFDCFVHQKIEFVSIDNASSEMMLFDVTEPLSPKIQRFTKENNKIKFKVLSGSNAFVLLKDSDFHEIKSIKRINNHNLHSLFEADMLIITDKIFASQAEEIKNIHEDDGLHSEVVFVDEIYNEFSSGAPDITGIRNFIRMIYHRASDLKYVLLLGRGSNDFKNVEGYGNNFVPPYEANTVVNEITSYVTDDYYGLMNEDEGENCLGSIDLGVGRIPVLTPDEADIAVGKIRRYIHSVKNMGNWRNNMLLFADDKKEYAKSCDALESMLDTLNPSINVDKTYADAFVRQTMSNGAYYYPDATASILNKIDNGIMMMTYMGHGGVQGLSASNILRITDIEKMNNRYFPFVVTATCEFSAFDDASFVSAGERFFLKEDGGAIAMYTTTRPTSLSTNLWIVKNFYKHVFSGDNIKTLRIGDLVRIAKRENVSNTSNYLSYVLYGDPALKLAYPEKRVSIDKINGNSIFETISVAPMDSLRVEGVINDENGVVDEDFNGILYPKMYDNKSSFQTLNNTGEYNNVYNFKLFSDVLYEGRVSVVNGRFSFTFQVPRSVNYQDAMARMSFYAADTVRMTDANGVFDNITVGGTSSVAMDNEGPEIQLLWNGEDFVDGEVENNGTLTAFIHDPQGIYHYGSIIGRDLNLKIESEKSYNSLIVNKYFEPIIDDFSRGTINIELEALDEGPNKITLRAWDIHDNSNEASIVVNVVRTNQEKLMKNVRNYPNPFSDNTFFTIDYNSVNCTADVEIKIFDVLGKIVNTLNYNNLSLPIKNMEWDGCDNTGRHLKSGAYIYKVYLKDSEGNEYNTTQRMMIIR